MNFEGRSGNVLVSELDTDIVIAGFSRQVFNTAGSIAVVLAGHDSFTRPFDSQTETSSSGIFGLDGELVGLVDDALLQTWSVGTALAGVADALDIDTEG